MSGNWDTLSYSDFFDAQFKLKKAAMQEKEMFDMKKDPWYILTNTPEERIAAQEWLFEQGITWGITNWGAKNWHFDYLTNQTSMGGIESYIMHGSGTPPPYAKEIKLTFKTETTVTNVEFPEILSAKQIEIKKIREEQENLAKAQQELAARLKKMEEEK